MIKINFNYTTLFLSLVITSNYTIVCIDIVIAGKVLHETYNVYFVI